MGRVSSVARNLPSAEVEIGERSKLMERGMAVGFVMSQSQRISSPPVMRTLRLAADQHSTPYSA